MYRHTYRNNSTRSTSYYVQVVHLCTHSWPHLQETDRVCPLCNQVLHNAKMAASTSKRQHSVVSRCCPSVHIRSCSRDGRGLQHSNTVQVWEVCVCGMGAEMNHRYLNIYGCMHIRTGLHPLKWQSAVSHPLKDSHTHTRYSSLL